VCEKCGQTFSREYWKHKELLEKNEGKTLCGLCSHGLNHSKAWANKDKTEFIEKMKQVTSFRDYNKRQLGKTFEERLGVEKAQQTKKLLSLKRSGFLNPMYGKPAPVGSGGGWSGWYNETYFRSFKELSFLVNVIRGQEFENAEKAKYAITYKDDKDIERTYFADYILNGEMIEIKPKRLTNTINNQLKFEAGERWCKQVGLVYKVITEDDYDQLSIKEVRQLYIDKKIRFVEKWQRRFEQKYL
jgi:hypothetical protein